jgi:minor extracellular serine protease Vpr
MKGRLYLLLAVLLLIAVAGNSLAADGTASRRDFTESPPVGAQSEYVIVQFLDPPVAQYLGDIPGLQRTKPQRGARLNPADPAARAYAGHLEGVHQSYRQFLRQRAPNAEVVREYVHAFNGMAIRLNGTRPNTLTPGPGVRNASFSTLYYPTLNLSTGIIGSDALWAQVP